jgi:outer membrane protein assembly factor BamE (lipoprotein component of BamABCDE complex)
MRRTILTCALLLAASCASLQPPDLRPGSSSIDDVRRTLGQPALELPNPDGSKVLAYPKGYYTGQTYIVHVGSDGLVKSSEQVLNEDHFYRIVAGLTRDDVLRRLGPPIETMEFARLQQVAWDYRYRDTWGYDAVLSVMFDMNGIVVGKVTRRIDRGDDKRK